MTTGWALLIALQFLLGGAALYVGALLVLRAREAPGAGARRRASGLTGWWSVLVGLTLAANAVVLILEPGALEVALFVRTVLLSASMLVMLPVVARAALIRLPRWLFAAVAAVLGVRATLWLATDLVFAHALDADGLPVYGSMLLPLTLPVMAVVAWWLVRVARIGRHRDELRPIVAGVWVGLGLVAASLAVPNARLAEHLTGLWLVPIALALELVSYRRDVAAERERRALGQERIQLLRELEHVNARLRDALRIQEDILAVTTHELKTPLTPLIGMLETLEARHDQLSPDAVARQLEVARRNAVRLHRLVDDLLNVSRLRGERDAGQPRRVAVAPLLHEVATMYAELASDAGVEVDADPSLHAWVDPGHLAQIVANLVSNAARYGAPPFRLSATSLGPDRVAIAVADHGPGVPSDFQQQLFAPFTRAERGEADEARGIGLGLSIARALVEVAGGRLRYESGEPTGACFVVELPTGPDERVRRLTAADQPEQSSELLTN